ncbi:MAG: winged helix-turn-helix domain-containing protein [Methanomicrobiales archaeon]|nr:winged helix-turn-helix domain-containing protein [Methanomicrobiales archaeon]
MLLRRLLTSGTRVEILTLFLLDPDREHYPREIERATGGNINAVRRELRNLEELGLLSRTARGNQQVYRVNRDFPLYPELSGLVLKTGGLAVLIRKELEALGGISYAFLYGPWAGGGAWTGDPQLFLVGNGDRARYLEALRDLRRRIAREIRILHLTPAAFRTRLGNGDPELRNLMEGPKTVIIPLS